MSEFRAAARPGAVSRICAACAAGGGGADGIRVDGPGIRAHGAPVVRRLGADEEAVAGLLADVPVLALRGCGLGVCTNGMPLNESWGP
eukprot:12221917-Alexandrium_andersonii.AAC.1